MVSIFPKEGEIPDEIFVAEKNNFPKTLAPSKAPKYFFHLQSSIAHFSDFPLSLFMVSFPLSMSTISSCSLVTYLQVCKHLSAADILTAFPRYRFY